jgi:phosphate transport system protein
MSSSETPRDGAGTGDGRGASVPGSARDPVPGDLPPLRVVEGADGTPLRNEYAARLSEVEDAFALAALRVLERLPRLTEALLSADRSLGPELREVEVEVRQRCAAVEEQCFLLLALEAPVSRDLRRVVSLLRTVHDVERAATLARHLAEAPARLDARFLPDDLQLQLRELATRSVDVLRRGVEAWCRRDALAVHDVVADDAEVDRLRTRMLVRARDAEGSVDDLVTLTLVGRYLERLADHGVALARHTAFAETGDRVAVED